MSQPNITDSRAHNTTSQGKPIGLRHSDVPEIDPRRHVVPGNQKYQI